MANELTTIDVNALPDVLSNQDDYSNLSRGVDFLSRVQLFTKGRVIDKGLIRPGHYGIPVSADEVTDLGDSIDLLLFASRSKAIDLSDPEEIVVAYNESDPVFKEIVNRAKSEDNSQAMFGVSFLAFVRSTGNFYEFFCGTKSTRAIVDDLLAYMPITPGRAKALKEKKNIDVEPRGPLPLTLRVQLIEKRKWSYHVPTVNPCSLAFTNLPEQGGINSKIIAFVNPVVDEPVEAAAPQRKSRVR